MIRQFEGLKLESYLCPAGVWTIGYGHTKGVKPGQTITIEQAERLLADDIAVAQIALKHVQVYLNDHQKEALTSFIFNVGATAFKNSTLLKKLNSGDYAGAAACFEDWCKTKNKTTGVVTVVKGLQERRKAERKLFECTST